MKLDAVAAWLRTRLLPIPAPPRRKPCSTSESSRSAVGPPQTPFRELSPQIATCATIPHRQAVLAGPRQQRIPDFLPSALVSVDCLLEVVGGDRCEAPKPSCRPRRSGPGLPPPATASSRLGAVDREQFLDQPQFRQGGSDGLGRNSSGTKRSASVNAPAKRRLSAARDGEEQGHLDRGRLHAIDPLGSSGRSKAKRMRPRPRV